MPDLRSATPRKSIGGATTAAAAGRTTIPRGSGNKTPNPKHQAPKKSQGPSPKRRFENAVLELEIWSFSGVWSLIFGVWNMVFGAWFLVFKSRRLGLGLSPSRPSGFAQWSLDQNSSACRIVGGLQVDPGRTTAAGHKIGRAHV